MNTKKSVSSELSYEQYVAWCRMSVPRIDSDINKCVAVEPSHTVAAPSSGPRSGPVTVRSNRDGTGVVIEPDE